MRVEKVLNESKAKNVSTTKKFNRGDAIPEKQKKVIQEEQRSEQVTDKKCCEFCKKIHSGTECYRTTRKNFNCEKLGHVASYCPQPNKRVPTSTKRQFSYDEGIPQPPNKKMDSDRGKSSAGRIYIIKPPEKN